MKNITKYLLTFLILLLIVIGISFTATAQVSINPDGSSPDASAMLDIVSADKGILIPRMDSNTRNNISTPATGLLVYDTSTVSFWYYDDNQWNEIRNGNQLLTIDDLLNDALTGTFNCLTIEGTLSITAPFRIAITGDYACVIDSAEDKLKVIDISDPTAPTQVGSRDFGDDDDLLAVDASAVDASGDYAYVGVYNVYRFETNASVEIIDISNPSNPTSISSISFGTYTEAIAVSGNYVYGLNADNSGNASTVVSIDVSNPNSPIAVDTLAVGSYPTDIAISGNYAYVVDKNSYDLRVIDISSPSNLTLSGSLSIGSNPVSVAVSGNYAYVVDQDSDDLKVIDISNPTSPTLSGSISIGNDPQDVAISGNNAFIVDYNSDDIKMINITDPTHPTLLSTLDIGSAPSDLSILDDYAYVVDLGSSDLKAIKIECDNSPVAFNPLNGTFENGTDNDNQELSISNNTLALSNGVNTVDLTNYLDNTDNQIIDTFRIDGNNLELSLESDDQAAQSVDLSTLQDDLGSHTASQNIQLNGQWLSNDGGNEGILIDNDGKIGIGNASPSALLDLGDGSGNDAVLLKFNSERPWQFEQTGSGANNTLFLQSSSSGKNFNILSDDGTPIASFRSNGGNSNRVGINTTVSTSGEALEVNGGASKTVPGSWSGNSDKRLKKNIEPLHPQQTLNKLLSLQGVTYEWNDNKTGFDRPEGIQYGFTAQNIQAIFPSLVSEDGNGFLQTAYGTYDAMYVEALRALSIKNDELKVDNEELKVENEIQNKRITRLEAQVAKINQLEAMLTQLQAQVNSGTK